MATQINAKIVADSICNGHRITTMLLTYPRFIHSEMCRHRTFSRNTASSRAIPVDKMIEAIQNDPVIPIAWQKQHPGMQGTEYITDPGLIQLEVDDWLSDRDYAVRKAIGRKNRKITKQLINRPLEPWMWTVELVTATEWENFFHSRCPQYHYYHPEKKDQYYRSRKDWCVAVISSGVMDEIPQTSELDWLQINKGQAEIHMMALAEAMWDARNESIPKELQPGEWHIPYDDKIEWTKFDPSGYVFTADEAFIHWKVKLSTAMCAQTSYTTVGEDGKPTPYENLLDLHNSLLVRPYTNRKGIVFGPDDPIHTSPAEHCAQAMYPDDERAYYKGRIPWDEHDNVNYNNTNQENHGWCHNLKGWKSYRSMIPNENRR